MRCGLEGEESRVGQWQEALADIDGSASSSHVTLGRFILPSCPQFPYPLCGRLNQCWFITRPAYQHNLRRYFSKCTNPKAPTPNLLKQNLQEVGSITESLVTALQLTALHILGLRTAQIGCCLPAMWLLPLHRQSWVRELTRYISALLLYSQKSHWLSEEGPSPTVLPAHTLAL